MSGRLIRKLAPPNLLSFKLSRSSITRLTHRWASIRMINFRSMRFGRCLFAYNFIGVIFSLVSTLLIALFHRTQSPYTK